MGEKSHTTRKTLNTKLNKKTNVHIVNKFEALNNLTCLYTNADQFKNKMTELEMRTQDHTPMIMGITEVKPKNTRCKSKVAEYTLTTTNNHDIFQKNIENEVGRGLLLYIQKNLEAKEEYMTTNMEEYIFAKIQLNSRDKLLVGLIYRSGSGSSENNQKLIEIINEACTKGYSHILLMGDFNYPNIDWEHWDFKGESTTSQEYKFIECLQDNFLYQKITEPTRWRGADDPHLLDLILTNEEDMISNIEYQSPLGKSDHCVINFTFNCYFVTKKKELLKTCYHKGDYNRIREDLHQIDWNEVIAEENNIESNWEKCSTEIKKMENKYIPSRRIRDTIKKKHNIPLEKSIVDKIKEKNKWARKAKHDKDPWVQKKYKRIRNKVRNITRKHQKQFERNLSHEAKSNPKKIWSYIKSKSKTKSGIGELLTDPSNSDSIKTDNDTEKAQILANFFESVFTREPEGEVPVLPAKQVLFPMNNLEISPDDVQKILSKLKVDKSPGIDKMHPRFLKEVATELSVPLTVLFNQSIMTGKLPKEWKSAQITAIYKKGQKCQPGNYRPVSLTSIICKCLESIVQKHILDFMVQNKFLSDKQYGFIPGRSTSLQLLTVLDKWTESIDQGHPVDCIYMDYQKAFDTVPHKRLINKLNSYGINNQILHWIENFLSDRRQMVCVNGCQSNWSKVTSGIPQGSVLGPLLFVIFINDLPDIVNSQVFLFADDTKIFRTIKNENDTKLLQEDLDMLSNWSEKWLLKFHPGKCKHMRIGRSNQVPSITYSLKSVKLEETNYEKDIGVGIDPHLAFDQHISEKVQKANQMFALLRRTFQYLDKKIFINLYKAMVRPHLEYAISVWSPYKSKHIEQIEGVQRRATKQLPGMKDKTYQERLQILKLPTLSYRRHRGDMIELYKILNKKYDPDATPFIKLWKDQADRTSGRHHSKKLFPQSARTQLRQNSFSLRTVKIWNKLPESIVSAPSMNSFKSRLDNYWKNENILYDYKAELLGIGTLDIDITESDIEEP